MASIRKSLTFDVVANDTGMIMLSAFQCSVLFGKDNELPGFDAHQVSLLKMAGQISLWRDSSNVFMKQMADRLFPELREKITSYEDMGTRQHYEAKFVKLLGQEVTLKTENTTFFIRGDDPYEVLVDLRMVCSGAVKMSHADGKSDVNSSAANLRGDNDASVNINPGPTP
ncbi:hypothetical protein N0V95_009902 [Ascochyta clinopodiicola]|nr:hypothetical protein N0V95_009902 [Ascochyta clinopodiicola]